METDHVEAERRILDGVLKPGSEVLDAGCGRTTRLRFFRDRIDRLVGVDADGPAGSENPYLDEFLIADLDDVLPLADSRFDVVYANFVVEHLARPEFTFGEWRRVLRHGGALVIVTSNRRNPLMAIGSWLPERVRLAIKRRGAGAAARDVYATHYRANTPAMLTRTATAAGFETDTIILVGTLYRYGARIPGAQATLRAFERLLPQSRRSTIVACYR